MPGAAVLIKLIGLTGFRISPMMANVVLLLAIGAGLLWYRGSLVAEGRSQQAALCEADKLAGQLAAANAQVAALRENLDIISGAADLDRALVVTLRGRIEAKEGEIRVHEQKQKANPACRATAADVALDRRLRSRRPTSDPAAGTLRTPAEARGVPR